MATKPKRKLVERLRDKYRLIIYNDNTFEEVGFIRLKGFNLLWILGAITFTLIFLTVILIAYTSVRELIPGYPDSNMRRKIVMNALKLDSLERQIEIRDKYFVTINNIISGNEIDNYADDSTGASETIKMKNISFKKSEKDSLFRKKIEEEEQFNLSVNDKSSNKSSTLSQLHFFTPIRGIVTNNFNPDINHYGVDIVAGPNDVIKATLEGTVILATWTIETGYVIQIQHDNNIVSIYKHNSELLKRAGNHVEAGDVIAIVGNSGEFTSGPHLHFELWQNGQPVNPEDYIVF